MIRDQLSYGLSRLAALARQRDWKVGEDLGLTPTQGDILRLLANRPKGLRLNQLAAQLSVRPSTASDAVSALVAKGLARRSPDPDSARAVRIGLSPDGLQLVGQAVDGHLYVVDLLSDAETEAMHRVVINAIRRLQVAGQIAPQRMCVTCRYFVAEVDPQETGRSYCRLIEQILNPAELRIDCPEHEPEHGEAAPSV